MADHQPKRASQRGHQDGSIRPPASASEPKAITNIYYDCLERIFDFLDLEDLLNVAGTCKRLQVAAAAKFSDDFGEKTIHLIRYNILHEEIALFPSRIDVRGSKNCLSFLRCFGAKIRHLHAWRSNDLADEYINKYCADSLISIGFSEKNPKNWISNASKPFKNVEKVVVDRYRDELSHFVDRFPKLRRLDLDICYITRFAKPIYFPNLEHLKVSSFLSENVLGILPAHPQLRSISISPYWYMTMKDLLNALKKSTSLMKLKLHLSHRCTPVDEDDIVQFAKQHPLLTELLLSEIEVYQGIMFIRHLTTLKRFKFKLIDHSEYNRLLDQLDSKWQHNMEQLQIELTC